MGQETPARTGLGSTTVLAVVTIGFGFVGGGKPSTSGWVTAIDLYVMLCFSMVFLAFVEFSWLAGILQILVYSEVSLFTEASVQNACRPLWNIVLQATIFLPGQTHAKCCQDPFKLIFTNGLWHSAESVE